jgi:fibronectin-binding autotransporter adhesin
MKPRFFAAIAAPAVLAFTASQVHAVTNYQGAGDDWTIPTNWSGGTVPTGAFNQRLNFNGGTTVTFTSAQGTVSAGAAAAENRSIVLGNVNPNASTGTATLNITGGILQAGTATTGSSLIGANGANSVGILNVSGTGILDLTTATNVNGRVLSLGLAAGANAGISGTVNLSGGGLIKVGEFRISDGAAPTGAGNITGILNLNGGTLETGEIFLSVKSLESQRSG